MKWALGQLDLATLPYTALGATTAIQGCEGAPDFAALWYVSDQMTLALGAEPLPYSGGRHLN